MKRYPNWEKLADWQERMKKQAVIRKQTEKAWIKHNKDREALPA